MSCRWAFSLRSCRRLGNAQPYERAAGPRQNHMSVSSGGGESAVTTDQVLSGVGLIVVLAVGCQLLASRLRIPALIIVRPAGFITGALTGYVNPEWLLGAGVSAAGAASGGRHPH